MPLSLAGSFEVMLGFRLNAVAGSKHAEVGKHQEHLTENCFPCFPSLCLYHSASSRPASWTLFPFVFIYSCVWPLCVRLCLCTQGLAVGSEDCLGSDERDTQQLPNFSVEGGPFLDQIWEAFPGLQCDMDPCFKPSLFSLTLC